MHALQIILSNANISLLFQWNREASVYRTTLQFYN